MGADIPFCLKVLLVLSTLLPTRPTRPTMLFVLGSARLSPQIVALTWGNMSQRRASDPLQSLVGLVGIVATRPTRLKRTPEVSACSRLPFHSIFQGSHCGVDLGKRSLRHAVWESVPRGCCFIVPRRLSILYPPYGGRDRIGTLVLCQQDQHPFFDDTDRVRAAGFGTIPTKHQNWGFYGPISPLDDVHPVRRRPRAATGRVGASPSKRATRQHPKSRFNFRVGTG